MVDKTFNVLEFITGSNYPTETVTLYTDAASAQKYVDLVKLDNDNANNEHEAEIKELETKINSSAILFDLQGLPPYKAVEIVNREQPEGVSDAEYAEQIDNELIAATVKGIKNFEGATDPNPISPDTFKELRQWFKEKEWVKLVNAVAKVNFNAAVFDEATDAGFPGGRADVAE